MKFSYKFRANLFHRSATRFCFYSAFVRLVSCLVLGARSGPVEAAAAAAAAAVTVVQCTANKVRYQC